MSTTTGRSTGPGGRQRVKTAKGRTTASVRWLERQLNDPYVRLAKAEGYRSRAAYKLTELDERFKFLKGSKRVIDLGIAPGGWAQVVRKVCPKAVVVGIDLLPVDPIDGVTILEMDFMSDAAPGLLAETLGDISDDQVWRVLRKHDICLQRRRSWCISTDPEFGPKAADIVGLYLNPPENALVLCVDEKPSIQALERAQGWLRLPKRCRHFDTRAVLVFNCSAISRLDFP